MASAMSTKEPRTGARAAGEHCACISTPVLVCMDIELRDSHIAGCAAGLRETPSPNNPPSRHAVVLRNASPCDNLGYRRRDVSVHTYFVK
eukprot:361200-Chlamydomonas_euryale.AAC.22